MVATYNTPSLDSNLTKKLGENVYFYVRDGLGSIRNILDSDETAQNTYDYKAFGSVYGSPTENIANRYRFTAREWESLPSLHFYRARMMDQSLGRFISKDQLFSENLYNYLNNSPIIHIDPLGWAQCAYSCCCVSGIFQDKWEGKVEYRKANVFKFQSYFFANIWILTVGRYMPNDAETVWAIKYPKHEGKKWKEVVHCQETIQNPFHKNDSDPRKGTCEAIPYSGPLRKDGPYWGYTDEDDFPHWQKLVHEGYSQDRCTQLGRTFKEEEEAKKPYKCPEPTSGPKGPAIIAGWCHTCAVNCAIYCHDTYEPTSKYAGRCVIACGLAEEVCLAGVLSEKFYFPHDLFF